MPDQDDRLIDHAPGTGAWHPWRPEQAMEKLAGARAPWCVAGGWALDLWHGKQTRPHDDLEIAILRPHFAIFRAQLSSFKCFIVNAGKVSALAPGATPGVHEHQIWILEESAAAWRMDILLEPGDGDTWVFRRDEAIRRPRSQMIATTAAGIPYLKPEGVLLYKAKAPREKDEKDFSLCAPLMEPAARVWLKDSLARVHPSHPWLATLQ